MIATTVEVKTIAVAVQVQTQPVIQVATAIQGPPGLPSDLEQFIAGQNLLAKNAIKITNGFAFPCDAGNIQDIGLAIGLNITDTASGVATLIKSHGSVINNQWNWTMGPVYVGLNGVLTQNTTELAFSQQIGIAVKSNTIIVNPQLGFANE